MLAFSSINTVFFKLPSDVHCVLLCPHLELSTQVCDTVEHPRGLIPRNRSRPREVLRGGGDPEHRRGGIGGPGTPAATVLGSARAADPASAEVGPPRCTLTRQARSRSKSRARRKRSRKASVSGCGVCGTPASCARRLSSARPGWTSGEWSGSSLSCFPTTGPGRISAMPAALSGRQGGKSVGPEPPSAPRRGRRPAHTHPGRPDLPCPAGARATAPS